MPNFVKIFFQIQKFSILTWTTRQDLDRSVCMGAMVYAIIVRTEQLVQVLYRYLKE